MILMGKKSVFEFGIILSNRAGDCQIKNPEIILRRKHLRKFGKGLDIWDIKENILLAIKQQ